MSAKSKHTEPRSPTIQPAGGDLVESIVSALVLLGVYAVLFTRFDMRLLFSDTTLTGGDTASWFQVLSTLKNDFLPKGRLFGFSQGNFFGYLEGQHYFILPFLSAALLGFVFPLTVALKVATVAGGFALPLTMFVAASSITGRKRAGALASALSLLFLFNESYTIFGGNWLSTFAGEFCFSWAMAFLPLLVASVVADRRQRRRGILSGILLGLIGLSHFFVFMPAFFLPFFPALETLPRLLRKRKTRRRAMGTDAGTITGTDAEDAGTTLRILATYAIAFLLMAFWLLPMAATRAWAQPISMIWHFSSFKDFARQTLAWIWAPLALLFLGASLSKRLSGEERHFFAIVIYSLSACAFLFYVAPGLGMPDIRFVPSALLLSSLGAAIFCESVLSRRGASRPAMGGRPSAGGQGGTGLIETALPSLAVMAISIAACAGAVGMGRNASSWYRWNYSGYEARTEWPAMETLGEKYKGGPDDGRFLWEKQDQRDNKDFGSERAFENLFLFTGHPTSEGIHYGSSMMARAATYLQSSYSPNPVDPEAERIYSEVDPQSWPARFALLNARYIVTHSEQITSLFASHPDFALDSKISKFSVFRYERYTGRYVSVLPSGALSIVGGGAGGFKTDYYRFFREYELYEYPFVSSEFADTALESTVKKTGVVWKRYDDYENALLAKIAILGPSSRVTTASAGEAEAGIQEAGIQNEQVDNFSIRFDTAAPGEPHYIRISYAPGWKSRGGEKIYPVAPGFMLMVPKTGSVELYYGRTIWEIVGLLLSLLSLPAAFAFWKILPRKRFPHRLLLGAALAVFALAAVYLALQASAGYPALAKDIEAARRLNLSVASQRTRALALVEPWATVENLERFDNRLVFDAFRIKALARLREKKVGEAEVLIETLRRRYSHTRALESLPTLK
ncbi:MAG TPA: hypothetical protein VN445_02770 [Rectinemataceae bacterium]|nr:hypothetical protein [Rectinemataceae bacterium]